MRAHRTFIYFFFLAALQDRHTGLVDAKNLDRTETEGGNITIGCSFTFSGAKKIFCRNDCEEKDILVQTENDRAQNDRYSIEYKEGTVSLFSPVLYVSITNLRKSDSGRYRCALGRNWAPDGYEEFSIRVTDAPTASNPNWALRPFSTSLPSASTLKTTQSLSFTLGGSKPSSAPETTEQAQQQTPAARSDVQLFVCVILVVMIVVLSVAVLIFCRNRASKPKGPPVEPEYANVTEVNREYEEIRQDRPSRPPPVEISTVYACAKYTEANGAESTDDYSFVTAASPQNKTEDESSNLTYSVVDFSDSPAALLNSAPRGDADNVTYSVPRVTTSSDASAPLYSTVTLRQQ